MICSVRESSTCQGTVVKALLAFLRMARVVGERRPERRRGEPEGRGPELVPIWSVSPLERIS